MFIYVRFIRGLGKQKRGSSLLADSTSTLARHEVQEATTTYSLYTMSFFCALSGEPPQDPVISTKNGHVYERRLILKYITDNGTDPITGDKLDETDLVSVKASAF